MIENTQNVEAPTEGDNPAATDNAAGAADGGSIESALSAMYDKIAARDSDPVEPSDDGAAEGAGAAATESDQPHEPEGKEATEATPALPRPAAWSADKEPLWASLPPEAKEYIAEREKQANDRISQQGQQLKQAEPLTQVLKDYPRFFEQRNMTPAEGIRTLIEAQALLESDAYTGIRWLAKSFGVDIGAIANGTNAEIDQLRAELAALRKDQALRSARDSEASFRNVESTIEKWSADKEFYAEVESQMEIALQAIPRQRADGTEKSHVELLDEAYETAKWATPSVREKLLAKEREAREAEKSQARRAADASKNRRTNAGVVGQPFAGSAKFDINNPDHMSRLYDDIVSRLE